MVLYIVGIEPENDLGHFGLFDIEFDLHNRQILTVIVRLFQVLAINIADEE